jgi:Flp pilus assembly protein TadG
MAVRFRACRSGVTAVEFAIIAPIFFAIVFAIFEIAAVFLASQLLETGLRDSARVMFTGEAYDSSMTAQAFKTNLCNSVQAMMDCTKLYVDVKSYPAGTAITITDPITAGTLDTSGFTYQNPPHNSSNTVVVRAFYPWNLYVTKLGLNLANLNNGQRLLAATTAFHVEPQ